MKLGQKYKRKKKEQESRCAETKPFRGEKKKFQKGSYKHFLSKHVGWKVMSWARCFSLECHNWKTLKPALKSQRLKDVMRL